MTEKKKNLQQNQAKRKIFFLSNLHARNKDSRFSKTAKKSYQLASMVSRVCLY